MIFSNVLFLWFFRYSSEICTSHRTSGRVPVWVLFSDSSEMVTNCTPSNSVTHLLGSPYAFISNPCSLGAEKAMTAPATESVWQIRSHNSMRIRVLTCPINTPGFSSKNHRVSSPLTHSGADSITMTVVIISFQRHSSSLPRQFRSHYPREIPLLRNYPFLPQHHHERSTQGPAQSEIRYVYLQNRLCKSIGFAFFVLHLASFFVLLQRPPEWLFPLYIDPLYHIQRKAVFPCV